jgi:hypothetical protein
MSHFAVWIRYSGETRQTDIALITMQLSRSGKKSRQVRVSIHSVFFFLGGGEGQFDESIRRVLLMIHQLAVSAAHEPRRSYRLSE